MVEPDEQGLVTVVIDGDCVGGSIKWEFVECIECIDWIEGDGEGYLKDGEQEVFILCSSWILAFLCKEFQYFESSNSLDAERERDASGVCKKLKFY